MTFRVDCPCGRHLTVTEGAAGAALRCECGRPVAVPELNELRASADLPAHSPSPELLVEHLLLAGELPGGKQCAGCGAPTEAVAHVVTECERAYTPSGLSVFAHLLGFLVMPVWWLFYVLASRADRSDGPELGKDKVYTLPLALCPACQKTAVGPAALKECLRKVPIYEDLLDKFPDATVRLVPR